MEEELSMIREEPMKFSEANAAIKRLRRYKLPDGVVPPGITLEQFIERFVTEWAIDHPTLYEHNGAVQTPKNKKRSRGDITRLCQTYFPKEKVCLEKVNNILKALLKKKKIDTLVCTQIHKRVFFVRPFGPQYKHVEERDEFGHKFNIDKVSKIPKEYS